MLSAIDHINIVVSDLPRMVAFYRDVLGLNMTKQVMISGEWIDRVVGLAGALGEVVYLELPEGPRVELIRYRSPEAAQPEGIDVSNTPGIRHLAFRVADIDAAVARLRQAGVEFLSDVQRVPEAQVTYAGGVRKRLVYFRDPEGNLLELCEYKPS
jgi:catechol 2,3-dioxygenase-like lactoylglutathione lyase family enzyme